MWGFFTLHMLNDQSKSSMDVNHSLQQAERRRERRMKVLELNQKHMTQRAIAKQIGCCIWVIQNDLRFLREHGESNIFDGTQVKGEKWIIAINAINKSLSYFTKRGIKPSLRTMFYRLVSQSVIEKTDREYGYLKDYTVMARLGGRRESARGPGIPRLPIDCFSDENRKVSEHYQDYEPTDPEEPDDYIQNAITRLTMAPNLYDGIGEAGGHWFGQTEYVEVWIEKFALASTFESFLEDRYVNIVVNKGYSSLTFLWENCKRLKTKIEQFGAEHVHILYFGDFDPSGEDMDRHIKDYFGIFGIDSNIFQRIALTPEQIRQYNIPLRPIKAKAGKQQDTRTKGFKAKYGNQAAEIDAFFASQPEMFERTIKDAVDQYFDDSIYEAMKEKYDAELPADKLNEIHNEMYQRITEAFSTPGWWDKEQQQK